MGSGTSRRNRRSGTTKGPGRQNPRRTSKRVGQLKSSNKGGPANRAKNLRRLRNN